MAEGDVARLFCWLSPTFPVGAYAYSHGLEWAVEAGDVSGEASLRDWLGTVLSHGAGRNDAILLAAAYRAAKAADDAALGCANDLALALAGTAELRLETAQQGRSCLDALLAAWPHPLLSARAARLGEVAYPVSIGLAAAAHNVSLSPALRLYLTAYAQNLVSAAIRLAPIGQTAGARVLAALTETIASVAGDAMSSDLDDIGSATFRLDLGAMRHETQYSRLFRS
jgi:urease accessory protein